MLSVERGERSFQESLATVDERAAHLQDVLDGGRSPLPEHPDPEAVSAWSTREHLRTWEELGLLR